MKNRNKAAITLIQYSNPEHGIRDDKGIGPDPYTYYVAQLKNSLAPAVGGWITADAVSCLIAQGFAVTINPPYKSAGGR